jgi:signal transduction histidine kinase
VAASDVIKDVKDLSSHLDGARLPDILLGARQAGRAGITKELSAGGKIFRVFATAVASQEASAAAIGTVMIIEDITEIKVRERSRDEFFSIASHELRTPLTAIRGNATMIADYYGAELKSPDLKAMIDDIHESSVRLIEIVNDFLDLSGLEQGKIVFDLKACALEPLLESVAYEMKSVLRSKQLYLKLDPLTLDALPKVWVDENRTKQVIYNLIGNAAKFTDSGGVTVTASTSGGFVKVVVTDTGQGIEKESRKLLFRKFQQAGSSILTRDSTRGTGLGLYISKLIVERMGGKIGLRSTAAGKGSSFYFTLPIAPR